MAEGYLELVRELFQPFGFVQIRRMFSGHGIYVDQAFVAIVWKDQVYLKADAESRGKTPQSAAEGGGN